MAQGKLSWDFDGAFRLSAYVGRNQYHATKNHAWFFDPSRGTEALGSTKDLTEAMELCEADYAKRTSVQAAITPLEPAEDGWDAALRGPRMSATEGLTIRKYQLPLKEDFTIRIHKGATPLRVDVQDGFGWLWAIVDSRLPMVDKRFVAVKCGAPCPDLHLNYVGFLPYVVQSEIALYVFEVL